MARSSERVLSGNGYEEKWLESVEFQEMWTPWIWKFFSHLVEYKRLSENSTSILKRDKVLGSLSKNESMYPWD